MPSLKALSLGQASIKGTSFYKPNLLLWLKADTNVSLSGSEILSWDDVRNNGTSFTSTSGSRPTISTINSFTSVAVSGSQKMTNSTLSFGTSYSIFAVANSTASPSYSRLLNFSSGDNFFFFGKSGSSFSCFCGNGSGWNDTSANSPAQSVGSSLAVISATNDGTTLRPYFGTTAQNTKTGTTTSSTGAILFTGGAGGANQYWTGNLLELLIYSEAVSASNSLIVQNYLAASYGI